MTDEPIDLDEIRRGLADSGVMHFREGLRVLAEVKRLRIERDAAIFVARVLKEARTERDAAVADVARLTDDLTTTMDARNALQARIDAALGLLRRWSGGLVPVGDYALRAETDAMLAGEAS